MAITVFGTPVCPNCKSVTSYLKSVGVDYEYKTVGDDIEQSALEELTGRMIRSVPVIVADGQEVTFEQLKKTVTTKSLANELSGLEL